MKHLPIITALILCMAAPARPDAVTLFRDNQSPVGGWDASPASYAEGTADALIIWSALKNNASPKSPWLAKAIENLRAARPKTTFAHAMRIMALCSDPMALDRNTVMDDASWLSDSQSPDGGWGVDRDSPQNKLNTLDTAWAVLALDRARACKVEVSPAIFRRAINFFQAAMNADGGYGHDWPKARPNRLRGQSNGLTTAAAITALDVIAKYTNEEDAGLPQSLADKAREWLSGKDSPVKIEDWYWGSQPLGEYRFFLAMATVDKQAVTDAIRSIQDVNRCFSANGLAEDRLIATAWSALTLAESSEQKMNPAANSSAAAFRETAPKIINKIEIAAWSPKDNYPSQAAATLSDELRDSYSLGTECTIIDSPEELEGKDAHVLWCTGCPKKITAQQQSQMLRFTAVGGLILVDAANDEEYESAEAALRQMFGDSAFRPATSTMPLITGNFAGGVGLDITDRLDCVKNLARPLLMLVIHKGRTVAILSAVPLAKIASGNFPKDPPMQPAIANEILLNIILFADTQ